MHSWRIEGVSTGNEVITYCQGGIRAAHAYWGSQTRWRRPRSQLRRVLARVGQQRKCAGRSRDVGQRVAPRGDTRRISRCLSSWPEIIVQGLQSRRNSSRSIEGWIDHMSTYGIGNWALKTRAMYAVCGVVFARVVSPRRMWWRASRADGSSNPGTDRRADRNARTDSITD